MPKNRITVKNELPELLEAVCNHPDCEDWLKDAIWDAVNNQNIYVTYEADYWRSQLNAMRQKPTEEPQDVLNSEVLSD